MLIGHTTRGLTLRYPIHIEDDARARHLYIVGATGTGKTGLLKNLIAHDAREGNGFAFIDRTEMRPMK